MRTTVARTLVTGIVAGLLGSGVHGSVLALLRWKLPYTTVLAQLAGGVSAGVALALCFWWLPRPWLARAGIAAVLGAFVEWSVVLPAVGKGFTFEFAGATAAANIAYGLVTAFVLGQALGLALPLRAMSRRAEEFQDSPAGA